MDEEFDYCKTVKNNIYCDLIDHSEVVGCLRELVWKVEQLEKYAKISPDEVKPEVTPARKGQEL